MARVALARPLRTSNSYGRVESQTNSKSPLPTTPSLEGGGEGGAVDEKKKISLDDLLILANGLPKSERKQLLATLALDSQLTESSGTRDPDMWSRAVYDGLVAATGGQDGGVVGPAVVKRLVATPAAFRPVASFMETSKMATLTVTERQSIYGALAKLVIENARAIARRSNIPLSPKLVSNCATNITGIFDQSFPGYLANGLALIVARRITSPNQA